MTNANESSLQYVQIVGPGVDALDHRKEHNNNKKVTARGLRASIDRVKVVNFNSLKMLRTAALKRVS